MYLWTSLFHEALFEVVPGEVGHELGEERQRLTPYSHPRSSSFPNELGSQTKEKFGIGKDVYSWFMGLYLERALDVISIFQQSQSTAPQMFAELTSMAVS